jgi:adenylate kinase
MHVSLNCSDVSALCILVFGVSGVGKSSACNRFVVRHPHWMHFRASELLRKATDKDPQLLRRESAGEIRANQAVLAEALCEQRRLYPDSHFLIDGHAIIDNDLALVRVPLEAVRALQPAGMILLDASAEQIQRRRTHDVPVRPQRSIAEIEREREEERDTVLDYARVLALPMVMGDVIGGFELDPLIAALVPTERLPN